MTPTRHCHSLLIGAITIGILAACCSTLAAQTPLDALPEESRVPGGVALLALRDVGDNPMVSYLGQRVMVIEVQGGYQIAVVGIPLSAEPGAAAILVNGESYTFIIQPREYAESRLRIADPDKVTPPPAALKRIGREQQEIRAGFATWSNREPVLPLLLPVNGRRSSGFGLRRFLNNKSRSPHSGLDLAAPTGTPVRSSGPGTVIATGNYYFNGKTLMVDQGAGLVSMYCHLNEILVRRGEFIAIGQIIGKVGATGRVTGPHLHWSLSINNTRVNPELFVRSSSPVAQAAE